MIIRKQLKYKDVRTQFDLDSFEWHGIRLLGNTNYLILTIYRKQEFPMSLFLNEFSGFLSTLCNNTLDTVIINGDFNVHFETGNKPTRDLTDHLLQFGLLQCVNDRTHIDGHTLDLIFCNPCELELDVKVDYDLSVTNNPHIKFDHFPILFTIPSAVFQHETISDDLPKLYKKIRKTSNIVHSEFVLSIQEQLDSVENQFSMADNFEEKLEIYNSNISKVLDHYAPLKTKVINPNKIVYPEWFDPEYTEERRTRRRLERQWKLLQTPESHLNYVNQRDYCVVLANSKSKMHYHNLIESSEDPSVLFKTVPKLWNKNSPKALPKITESATVLANDLNTFFSEKVTKIRNSIDTDLVSSTEAHSSSSTDVLSLHCFEPATLEELKEITSSMDLKSSFDDPLPAPLYKSALNFLLPYILELVNLSLSSGDMSGLKESTISPILKKAGLDQEIFPNYRPLMNLQFLSKVIEKVVLKRLNAHMDRNNLHNPNQYGYKKNHSTETLLLEIVDQTLIGYDKNSATVLVLLDMSAAFDTVDLKKLLDILENKIGLKGVALKWFQSFLLGRKQKVKINGFTSELLYTLYGVPQGSVLGPVLFNIYVASLSSVIEGLDMFTSTYADDTNARIKLSLQFQYFNISIRIPALLKEIHKWMNSYFLKLNPTKSEIILLCPPNLRNSPKILGVNIDGKCIRFSKMVKFLGVYIDSYLDFDYQTSQIVTSSMWHLKNISKIARMLSQSDLEKLVNAFVCSKLDYCNGLLFGIKISNLNKLQAVQNKAARIVLKLPYQATVTDKMLFDLHWLKVNERIIFKLLLTVHKYFVNRIPDYYSEQLKISNHHTRTLKVLYLNSKSGRRSFSYAAPRFWNKLDKDTRKLDDTDKFKKCIKTALMLNTNNIINADKGYRV